MITIIGLMDALDDFLLDFSKNYRLDDGEGNLSMLNIYKYAVKEKDGLSAFPYILFYPVSGENDVLNSRVTIRFLVGTGSHEGNYEALLIESVNITEALKLSLLKKGVIGKFYNVETPIKYDFYDEFKVNNYANANISVDFTMPNILREV